MVNFRMFVTGAAQRGIFVVVIILNLAEWSCGWSREGRHILTQPLSTRATMPPVFDLTTPTNVTVTATKTAMLSCIVHNLGNNSVSWIRHRDLHILSVGSITYTTDSRFQVVPHEGSGNWLLRIRYANTRDTGQYDCQVSSTPPTYRTTHLTVVEPRAKILRSPEMHVGLGSLINLTCIVPYSPDPPYYLHWYHREKMVREDGARVSVETFLGIRSESQLVIREAKAFDSGIYTCSPAHALEDFITVHVLTGEYPAAMQKGSVLSCGIQQFISVSFSVLLSTDFFQTISRMRHVSHVVLASSVTVCMYLLISNM